MQNIIQMGNFCMSDEGRNGIADRKHEKPPKGFHFRPRARRARGRKWRPVGGNFLCLRSAIPFMPKSLMQKLHLYILFSGIYISGKWKMHFLPRAENAFSPKGINGISDWLGRNFFADRSAKQFLPAGNNISGKISWLYALFFRKYCFRKWLPEKLQKSP